jgi:hypothetical protein
MNNRYHKYTPYEKLKTVMLGTFYTAEYFDFIDDILIRKPLQQIATEINEDLDYYAHVLTTHGCHVIRPVMPSVTEFVRYYQQHQKFMMPPLQPRNAFTVIGDTLYILNKENAEGILESLRLYNNNIVDLIDSNTEFFNESIKKKKVCYNSQLNKWYRYEKYMELAGPDWPDFYDYVQGQRSNLPHIAEEIEQFESALCYETKEFRALQGPNIFPTESGLVIDCNEYCDYETWFCNLSGYRGPVIRINTTAGHTDGCFIVLGNKTIIGIDPLIDYAKSFPGYYVIGISSKHYMDYVNKLSPIMKDDNSIWVRWQVQGQESNSRFINFVEKYLQEWTGYAYETVFDVNILAIDETTVCTIGKDPAIIKQLNNRGIECITIPWRHRFFVDCGLHCLTLDLDRDSSTPL